MDEEEAPAPAPRRSRWPLVLGLVALAVVLVAVVGLLRATSTTAPAAAAEPSESRSAPASSGAAPASGSPSDTAQKPAGEEDMPPVGLEESGQRLLPVPAVRASRAFAVSDHQDHSSAPITWSPCRPIHFVLNPQHAPAGATAFVQSAFARLSRATGLEFVFDGSTSETLAQDRSDYQPDRYGDRWAPVLVSFAATGTAPDVDEDTEGVAAPSAVSDEDGVYHYVTGDVTLNADYYVDLSEGGVQARATLLHELGHLVGLDHVSDKHQLMYPDDTTAATDYQTGDLAGLAAMGSGPCAPHL